MTYSSISIDCYDNFQCIDNNLRHQLTCNTKELKLLLGQIVTKKWHALHVELLKVPDEKIGYEEFMNL